MLKRLAAFFDRVRDLTWVLARARFTLLVLLIALLAFVWSDQMQDVFRGLASDLHVKSLVAFASSLVWWAINCWFFTWLILYAAELNRPGAGARGEGAPNARIQRLAVWLPRIVAWLPFAVVAIALTVASALPLAGCVVVLGIIVVALIYHLLRIVGSRALLRVPEPLAMTPQPLKELPPGTKAFLIAHAVVGVALFIWALGDPVGMGQFLGPHNVVFIATATWIATGTSVMWLGHHWRIPIISLTLLWVFAVSGCNDNHAVRTLDSGGSGRPALHDAFLAWQKRHADVAVAGTTAPRQPLVIVTTAGGGARAAYWTAALLSHFQDTLPRFGNQLFAISSVSGGTLGAAVFVGLLTAPETAISCAGDNYVREHDFGPTRRCASAVLQQDFLGPTLAAGLYPDLVQRFLPVAFLPDRASALERAWEAAWTRVVPAPATMFLSASFIETTRATRAPVLMLNGTSAASGQRIVTSNVVLSPAEFPDVADFFQVLPRDVRVSTAVNNTARFPYVAPAGLLCAGACRDDAIVDGGYFENFGAVTARQVIDSLYWDESLAVETKYHLIVIAISSDPDLGSEDDKLSRSPGCIEPAKRPEIVGLGREVLAPPFALAATREARGNSAVTGLHRRVNDLGTEVAPSLFLTFRMTHRLRSTAPLGWSLSDSARRAIDNDLDECPNKENYAALRECLNTGACVEPQRVLAGLDRKPDR